MLISLPVGLAAALAALLLLDALHQDGPLTAVERSWQQRARERGRDLLAIPIVRLPVAAVLLGAGLAAIWIGGVAGIACGVGLGIGALAATPLLVERAWHSRHEEALSRQAPAMLRQWAMALDGGGSPVAGLRATARREDHIGREVRRVLLAQGLRQGNLSACWQRRARILTSPVLAEIGATLAAVERTGAPLAALLRALAADLDRRHAFRDRIRAASQAPIRQLVSGYVLIFGMILALSQLPAWVGQTLEGAPPLLLGHWLTLGGAVAMSLCITALTLQRDVFLE